MLRKLFLPLLVLLTLLCTIASARECHEFRGAGILSYAIDTNGTTQVLLSYQKGRGWTSFGGGPKMVRNLQENKERCETRQETAIRETVEESRYLLTRTELQQAIAISPSYPQNLTPQQFQTFVVKIHPRAISHFYTNSVLVGKKFGFEETSELAWFPLKNIIEHIKKGTILKTPNNIGLWDVFEKGLKQELKQRNIDQFFQSSSLNIKSQ